MGSVEELYRQIVLEHSRSSRNRGTCPGSTVSVQHDNPLCGDTISLDLQLDGDRIACVAFEGRGCAISQASASMMIEAVRGLTPSQALELEEAFRRLVNGQRSGEGDANRLGELMALESVSRFPVRIRCALLPWLALKDALGRGDLPL